MARKKGGGGCVVWRLFFFTLAAFCIIAADAQTKVYTFTFNPSLTQSIQGLDDDAVSALHDDTISSALGFSGEFIKLHDYKTCFNGAAVAMTPAQAEMMQNNAMISNLEEDRDVWISTTHSHEYMLLAIGAWNKSGGTHNAGEDVVIGVVDTGIYPDHPSFAATDGVKAYGPHPTFKGSCATDARVPGGFCNGKIVAARAFFDGAIASGITNTSDPDSVSPLDGNGHGTHCAGTAAGNFGTPVVVNGQNFGTASGTAPRARIAAYKALNMKGQGKTSDIIKAIDQAIQDGVHVLSLSLGPDSAPAGNITFTSNLELACLGAVNAGVFVAHAAGNTGPGPSTVTSWSPWLTSVAATGTDRSYPSYLYTSDGKSYSGQGLTPGTPGTTSYPMISATDAVAAGKFLNPDFDCANSTVLNKKLITGKILVCSYTGFDIASLPGSPANLARIAAETMGAVAVVLNMVNTDTIETRSPSSWNFQNFPAISITGPTSEAFLSTFQAASRNGVVSGRLSGGNKAEFTGLPPKVAPFSARGPNVYIGVEQMSQTDQPVADVLKPSLVAPGVDIWSAWTPLPSTAQAIFRGEKWSMISGTSMAVPHLAGVAAIVRQMHPQWSPSTVASALATTAIPLDSLNNPLVAYDEERDEFGQVIQESIKRPGNAFDFGSGFVDADSALNPGLIFDATYTDYIKFLCSVDVLSPAMVRASTSETCPASPGVPTDLNLPSITVGTLNGTLDVPRTVTNVGPLETYTAIITKPADVDVAVVPATFTIAPGKTQLFTVTLTALKDAVYVNQTSFGRIYLTGDLGHRVQVPVTVTYRQV